MIRPLFSALLSILVSVAATAASIDDLNAGAAALQRKAYDDAIGLCTKAHDAGDLSEDGQALALLCRATAYWKKGAYDEGIAELTALIGLKPGRPKIITERGIAYRHKGDPVHAIEDLDAAIYLLPSYVPAHNGRGYANFDLGQFRAAADDFTRSLSLDPYQPYTVLWLHVARIKTGKDDQRELTRNAARLDLKIWPGPLIAIYLGQATPEEVMIAAAAGDEVKQREHSCDASYFLGEAALFRNNLGDAERLIQKASEICPISFAEFPSARAELKRLAK